LFLRGKEVVAPHLEAVQKEATTEELIGNDKLGENNGKVEELAEDETVEVDVVLVMDVFAEVFHKALPLLVLVFNKSACGALPKELHEASLNHQPEHAR